MSDIKKINTMRNIGISAHIDAGKTTTSERILYYTGKSHKIGEVHDGSSTMDYMDQEKERGITIQSASIQCKWYNTYDNATQKEIVINLIDTPGHVDFTVEVERSLRVLDGAIIVLEGVAGVEPQTITVWRQADKYKLPRMIYVNKMDRMGANFEYVISTIHKKLTDRYIVFQIPVGAESEFSGMIDLVRMVYFHWETGNKDEEYKTLPIPEHMKDMAQEYRNKLLEKLSDISDELLSLVLEGKEIPEKLLYETMRKAVIGQKVFPILCGSSFKNKGVQQILNAVADFFPAPNERGNYEGISYTSKNPAHKEPTVDEAFSAFIFKIVPVPNLGELSLARIYSGTVRQRDTLINTHNGKKTRVGRILIMQANKYEAVEAAYAGDIVAFQGLDDVITGVTLCNIEDKHPIVYSQLSFPAPVISQKITSATKNDDQKLTKALSQMTREDPSFIVTKEGDETILSGMGSLHLEIKQDILKRTHGVNFTVGEPSVNYKEAPMVSGSITHELKQQTGGAGKYAKMTLELITDPDYKKAEFVNQITKGVIDIKYIPSVEAGIREAMANGGPIGRYPVIGWTIKVTDGAMHSVDSSTEAFRIAAVQATRELLKKLGTVLLEPLMDVTIYVPDEYFGAITGDLAARGGIIGETTDNFNVKVISAVVPIRAMNGYIDFLRAATRGLGSFVMEIKQDNEGNNILSVVPTNLIPQISKSREHIHYRSETNI